MYALTLASWTRPLLSGLRAAPVVSMVTAEIMSVKVEDGCPGHIKALSQLSERALTYFTIQFS